jgi:hypothetical protein
MTVLRLKLEGMHGKGALDLQASVCHAPDVLELVCKYRGEREWHETDESLGSLVIASDAEGSSVAKH